MGQSGGYAESSGTVPTCRIIRHRDFASWLNSPRLKENAKKSAAAPGTEVGRVPQRPMIIDQTRYAESFGIGIAASVPQRTTRTGIFTTKTTTDNCHAKSRSTRRTGRTADITDGRPRRRIHRR